MLVGRAISTTGVLLPNLWDAAMAALTNLADFSQNDDEKLTLGRVRSSGTAACQRLQQAL